MAEQTNATTGAANFVVRDQSKFHILVKGEDPKAHKAMVEAALANGGNVWVELPQTREAVAGEGARKACAADAVALDEGDTLRDQLYGKGVDFRSVSVRGFKPDVMAFETPKPRLKRRS